MPEGTTNLALLGCGHARGFANVREIQKEGHIYGVLTVCLDGCGQTRKVYEDGTVETKETKH